MSGFTRCLVVVRWIGLLLLIGAAAQLAAADLQEDLIAFNPDQLQVQQIGGRWKIVEGNHALMDFESNEAEARRSLEIIQHYKMNAHGFVGRPNPSMEYWLVNGKSPVGKMDGEDAIPFNPDNIEVVNIGGRYKIVEGDHWIMDFAASKGEADQALEIIKKYGFRYICYVGRPNASMTYFRADLPLLKPLPGIALQPGMFELLLQEDIIKFNPNDAQVELIGGSYKIVVNGMSLLDFGDNKAEAYKALAVIKFYKLDGQGFVGRPDPSMTYYLVGGQSPSGAMPGEDAIGFNPLTIEVKQVGGSWKIVDGAHMMMDFGNLQGEANTALRIIKKYGFDHICFVGRPGPSMVYFRCDGKPVIQDCIPFDYKLAQVKNIGGRWKIVVGDMWLLDFADKSDDANRALKIIKQYKMTSQCFVGRPNPSMVYYLCDGKPPAGAMAGEDAVAFNPLKIDVKSIDGRWKIVEGDHWIMDFADNKSEADQAFEIIKQYRFNHICFVGRPDPSMVYFRIDAPHLGGILGRILTP